MKSLIPIDDLGMTEQKGQAVVNSRFIAETFSKRHDHVLRDIETALNHFVEIGAPKFGETNFMKSAYKDSQNKKQPEYFMTRDGFAFIAMGFTGKKAAQFKIDYINRFNQMEHFIKDLIETKAEFPEFTDAILQAHDEPKPYHFSNEVDMINRIVLGMSASQYRKDHGIETGKSIRPYLTDNQIVSIRKLQRIDIGLILTIADFELRKKALARQYERIQLKLSA